MNQISTALFLAVLFISIPAFAGQEVHFVADQFPPYYYEKNGQQLGLFCDLIALTFKKMNTPVKISFTPWKRALVMAKNNITDGIMGILKTKERQEWLIYADEPISTTQIVIFYRNGEDFKYKDIESLSGKHVGVIRGYYYGSAFMQSNLFAREEVDSLNLNFRKLLAGRVDLVAAFKSVGLHVLDKMGLSGKISFSPVPVFQSDLYLTFTQKEKHKILARKFSEALREIKKSPACLEVMKNADLPIETISPCN